MLRDPAHAATDNRCAVVPDRSARRPDRARASATAWSRAPRMLAVAAPAAPGGDSGCMRCTGRGGGCGAGGFAKSREVGAGSGSGAGGTENSRPATTEPAPLRLCFGRRGGFWWRRRRRWKRRREGLLLLLLVLRFGRILRARRLGLRGRPCLLGRLQADVRRRAVEHHHDGRVFGLGGPHGRKPPDRRADQDMQQDRQRQGGGRHVLQSRRDESDVVGHGDPVLRAVGVGG